MKLLYPAIIHNDPDGLWLEFPDLPGCQTFADNENELMKNAREAVAAYCVTLFADYAKLPTATSLTEIKINNGKVLAVVEADLTDKI